jgi:tetratricopeptide (TPR) repeat protein
VRRAWRAALLGLALATATARADEGPWREVDLAIAARDYHGAGAALLPILDDPERSVEHPAAWARMGDLFADNDLPYAALLAYARAAEVDLDALGPRLDRAIDLAAQVGDEAVLESSLTEVPDTIATPLRTRAKMLGARHRIRAGDFEGALDLLKGVRTSSPWYARVQHLRGIAHSNLGNSGDALAALLTAEAASTEEDPEFRAMVVLNTGRAYFAGDNFLKAIEYFGSVPRESLSWQEAVFERAWGHFRIQDHAGAYAVLTAIDNPFFSDWYWAEADLLRIYALFMMCKFGEAGQRIDAFIAKYTPIHERLEANLGMSPGEAWEDAMAWMGGGTSRLPPAVLARFRWEERFSDARSAVAEAQREIQVSGKLDSPWSARAVPLLTERRDSITREEGQRVLDRAAAARTELAEYLDGIQLVKLDILQFEADLYTRAAATGELEFGDRIGRLRALRKRRGERSWPFEGEYWADEIGYYRIEARSDCPEDQPR